MLNFKIICKKCGKNRTVKPHTLKTGDNIAFYVNSVKTKEYQTKRLTTVDKMSGKIEFDTTYNQMLGIHPILLGWRCKVDLH